MQTLESSVEALANRVARLEAQNRHLKKAGVALLTIASAVIAIGQAPTKKVIEANEFVLRDAFGQARARLSMETTDRPTLSFYKDKTTITASLAAGDEPFLTLQRAGTNEQVQLGANKGWVGLAIYQKEIRAGLSVQKGAAALDLFDANGRPQTSLTSAAVLEGLPMDPGLTIRDPDSKAYFSLGVSPFGAGPNFSMHDSAGIPNVLLLTSQGETSLKLQDKEGFSAILGSADLVVPETGRKESTSAATLTLFDKDNKVLWSAP